jgi:hypothetical protein
MGRGIWVHGTIKFVNVRKKKQEQTYKVLFDGDIKMTKTCHAHLEAEPEDDETASSALDDELALKGLGLEDDNDRGTVDEPGIAGGDTNNDNDADEDVTPTTRRNPKRGNSTQGVQKFPPKKRTLPRRR